MDAETVSEKDQEIKQDHRKIRDASKCLYAYPDRGCRSGEQKGDRPNRRMLWEGAIGSQCMPAIFGCFHLCFETQNLSFLRVLKSALEYTLTYRVRVHEGEFKKLVLFFFSYFFLTCL